MAETIHTITTKKSPQEVYELVSQPEKMPQWFCNSAEVIDNGFKVAWETPDGSSIAFSAEILETKPPNRFSYRTFEEHPLTSTFVIEETANGTKLTLTESGFPDDEKGEKMVKDHSGGWQLFLNQLAQLE